MPYLYLLCAITSSAALAVAGSLFNRKNHHKEGLGNLYNAIGACSNFATWLIVFCTDPSFEPAVLPYSIVYGLSNALFWVGLTGALQSGSSALTGFIKQIAFVFVAIWGLFFWGAEPTVMVLAGLALIAVALFLCLVPIGKGVETFKITWKWCGYAFLILLGNAGCSILQRTQQRAFDGQFGNQLMVCATLIAAVTCGLMCLKDDTRGWKQVLREYWYYPVIAGSSSAICNVFIILMASTSLSTSLIYPALAIGGLTLTTMVSVLVCKERLKLSQWIGLVIGAVALVLLNL